MRHFRWWFEKPIMGIDGLLGIGYAYPNLVMTENYNAPDHRIGPLKLCLFLPYRTIILLASGRRTTACIERSTAASRGAYAGESSRRK